jgi:FHA domain-containing protein
VITLTVISFNGAPAASALSGRFDELGGTIGRADTNHLVLPDPDRTISRVHAQVVFRNGSYAIVDRGSNPISVNGQRLGSGSERLIKEGDQVEIGGYVLSVQMQAAGAGAASKDPFADLLGPIGAPAAKAAPSAPWDPLSPRPAASGPSAARAATPPPAAAAGGIPDDWNPFAPTPAQSASKSPLPVDSRNLGLDIGAAAPAPLISGLSSSGGGSDSLDALFGLKPGAAQGDPLGGSMLAAAAAQPNMAAHADPLRSLQAAPMAAPQSLQDDFSDLHRPFVPPAAPVAAPAPVPVAPPAPVGAGAVLSWDAQAEGRTVIRSAVRATEPPATEPPAAEIRTPAPAVAPPPAAPKISAAPATPPPVAPSLSPAASPESPAATVSGDPSGVLLAALREGLAMPGVALESLTPDLMKLLGQIVREAASGTVDLLVARAALKREVRAAATLIVARENNPLKFSPSAEAALQHLLSPPVRGFMAAAPAMRDAYNDLRAHQYGFLAGMRAALEGVLQRFDPAELEGQLIQLSVLKSLLPGSRKAAMWDVFTEHYAHICEEAEDDFQTLFGKAFLQAYEEHIAQLDRGKS